MGNCECVPPARHPGCAACGDGSAGGICGVCLEAGGEFEEVLPYAVLANVLTERTYCHWCTHVWPKTLAWAERALRNRTKRLARLREFGAPASLIAKERRLVEEAEELVVARTPQSGSERPGD